MKLQALCVAAALVMTFNSFGASQAAQARSYPELPEKIKFAIKSEPKDYMTLAQFLGQDPKNVEATTPGGQPLIVYVADDPIALNVVLLYKPDLNRTNKAGSTALINAVRYEQDECVRLLVRAKANLLHTISARLSGLADPVDMNAFHFADMGLRAQCVTALHRAQFFLYRLASGASTAEEPKKRFI